MELSPDLPTELVPLAWLIGTWQGAGVGGYPTIEEDFRFGQEVTFSHSGKPFLHYLSRTWLLDDEGQMVRPLAQETGYWRPRPNGELEVLLTHPTGYVEIYLGRVDGPRIELRTDVVARTESAKPYSAGHRLYGLVNGNLMWAYDMAAMDQRLQSHISAELKRVS